MKGNHVSLSSATIPDDLTMSSASVFDTFSSNIEQEKESLVTRSVLSDRFVSFRPLDCDWSDDSCTHVIQSRLSFVRRHRFKSFLNMISQTAREKSLSKLNQSETVPTQL